MARQACRCRGCVLLLTAIIISTGLAAPWGAAPALARGLPGGGAADAYAASPDVEGQALWHPDDLAVEAFAALNASAAAGSGSATAREDGVGESAPMAEQEAAIALPGSGAGGNVRGAGAHGAGSDTRATFMRCLGTTTTTRACHFQDVYYDLGSKCFIYFGPAGVTPQMFGKAAMRGDPWLRLIRGADRWTGREKKNQFFLDWRSGKAPPPAKEAAVFDRPLHLRSPVNLRSLGHFLRDNLLPLIDLPLRFGREPMEFDWVRWSNNLDMGDWEEETRVAEHYRGLFNNRPSLTWQEVLDKALAGQPPGVKYIRFAEIIAGQGPADMMSHVRSVAGAAMLAQWAQMCGPFPFTAMREVAYRNHGLQVASVQDLEPFVLFLDGRRGEKRYLANADDVIPGLQETFPGVRMEHVQISKHTLEEQLALLSKATVMVSNIGSRSFRLIYLPNGAHVILVGPPEYEFVIEDGASDGEPERYRNKLPFFEIDACWGYIGYVSMLQYHVEREAEVLKTKPWKQWKDARDSDILLDEQRLGVLLRLALQQGGGETPFTGSGTLSAYKPAAS